MQTDASTKAGYQVKRVELSAIELQAVKMAADGKSVKHMVRELGITFDAAKGRRKAAIAKLKAPSMPAAVAAAIRAGMIA